MKYIFDFDHTLYSTEKFIAAAEPYKESGEWLTPQVWEKLDAASFFYDDTIAFLKTLNPADVIILTAWSPALGDEAYEFQEAKVEKSGVTDFVSKVVIMEGDKGPQVKTLYDGSPTVFVDDRIDHLLSARKYCPEVHVVQMVRDGVGELPGNPSVPIATTLAEIKRIVGI